ncbi:MAG: hypothetical protein HZC18_05990 [Candidatus Omnitrophica bacterium]|nr:hypothetical protein [Candidatus Omnitrophota bacterium]
MTTRFERKIEEQLNTALRKQKEDTTWVARAGYDKVEQRLREKQKELERIKRESGK